MEIEIEKEYIYIAQASNEKTKCKIGLTGDLEERLKTYNRNITGQSSDIIFSYIFTCEVSDMRQVERDIKENFSHLREQKRREIYFYNEELFKFYVKYIKEHPLFEKEIEIKKDDSKREVVKIISRTAPSLQDRRISSKDVLQKAQKAKNDEFYTRYEDVEKEVSMYDKNI